MRVKKIALMILIIAGLPILILLFFNLPWVIIHTGAWFSPRPLEPTITRGEFPFRIDYKIGEEKFTVKDTFIAEFDGFGWNAGHGRYRLWRGWIKGSKESNLLLISDDIRKVYVFVGNAEFYMNDERWPIERPFTPHIFMVKIEGVESSIMFEEELMKEYSIKIIEYSFSEPIINSFR